MTSDEECFQDKVDYRSLKKKRFLTKLYSDRPRHSCILTHRSIDVLLIDIDLLLTLQVYIY